MENLGEIIDYLSSIVGILIVLVIAITSYLLIKRSLLLLQKKKNLADNVIKNATRLTFWSALLFSVLFILQQFGVPVATIISSLLAVAAMVAIGFIAVWSVLSNFLCSLLLIIFRPFQVGDDIEITEPFGGSSLRGKVLGFNVMYTSLLEKVDEGEVVTSVPNNVFFQKAIRKRTNSRMSTTES